MLFRPLILAHLGTISLDAKARIHQDWSGPDVGKLQSWLDDADQSGDIEVFRKLYEWRLAESARQTFRGPNTNEVWRADLLRQARVAKDRPARHTELRKVDLRSIELDEDTVLALYELDPLAAPKFILSHLPTIWWGDRKQLEWMRLLKTTRARGDLDLHFELYRRLARQETSSRSRAPSRMPRGSSKGSKRATSSTTRARPPRCSSSSWSSGERPSSRMS